MMTQTDRKDTLKFIFDKGFARPRSFEFEDWLETELKLGLDDVIGINFSIVSSVVFVKLSRSDLCEKIVESCKGEMKFKHSDGNVGTVYISHSGFGIRTVRIFELPFEVTSADIDEVISPYGKVISNVAERFNSAHRFPVLTGVRQLKVNLRRHIPSYIEVCGHRAIVMYDDQPKTCARCGATGHVRAKCMQQRVAQLPAGEADTPPVFTTLPVTYAAAARGLADQTADPDINTLEYTPETDNLMETDETKQQNTSTPTGVHTPVIGVEQQAPEIQVTGHTTVDGFPVTPMDSSTTEIQNPPASLVQPPLVDDFSKQTSAVKAAESTPVDAAKTTSVREQSPPRGSSPENKKKPRLVRSGADKTATLLREKAKEIGAQLRQTADASTNKEHKSVSLPSTSENVSDSTMSNDGMTSTPKCETNGSKVSLTPLGEPLNTIQSSLPTSWAEETEIGSEEEKMDTSVTKTATSGVPQDGGHKHDDALTDVTTQTGHMSDPFPNNEYY